METQQFGEMMEPDDEVNFALDGLIRDQPVKICRVVFADGLWHTMVAKKLYDSFPKSLIDEVHRWGAMKKNGVSLRYMMEFGSKFSDREYEGDVAKKRENKMKITALLLLRCDARSDGSNPVILAYAADPAILFLAANGNICNLVVSFLAIDFQVSVRSDLWAVAV
ncbi:hypothetical protein L1887_18501 [Cichorium endivia]|nr:hypothetical protein L1887_18501 [Cichorium endivia]